MGCFAKRRFVLNAVFLIEVTLKKKHFSFAEAAFKARIDAIKAIALMVIQQLKSKGDNSYKEMNDWLGSRFMKEIDSIKVLIEVIKHSIENKEKIKQELLLQQEDFFIDTEIVVLRSPTPPRRPDPVEILTPEYFSIDALNVIFAQVCIVFTSKLNCNLIQFLLKSLN